MPSNGDKNTIIIGRNNFEKRKWDMVFIVTGTRNMGMSEYAMRIARYLDEYATI